MAAESSAAAWAGLRADLLERVLARLSCLAHRAMFAAVCFNWRSLTLESAPTLQQLPWLLLPSTAAQGPSFSCLLCGATHCVALPGDVRDARCCGSFPGGWLVLALEQFSRYALHNLHTGLRILLPDILGAPGTAGRDIFLIMHANARTQGDLCLAATVTIASPSIAFWPPGMDRWSPPRPAGQQGPGFWPAMVPSGAISDVVYYSGHGLEGFHVLTDTEELLVYVPEHGPEGAALTTRLGTYHFPNHKVTSLPPVGEGVITRYLVDYLGELLMVVRAVSPQGHTVAFSVFRLTGVVQREYSNNNLRIEGVYL